MTGTANPLLAKPGGTSGWAGIYLAEDIQTLDQAFRSGSWIDGAIGGFGATMDALGLITDPLGTLASWGVAWLEEHVKPLHEALNKLAGNPAQISADAQSWRNVGKSVAAQAAAMKAEVAASSHWQGDAADGYRDHAGQQWSALDALAKAADTLGTITEGAGLVVALVRTMVRDGIADFVSTLAVRLPEWLAEEGLTLGIATPWVAAQVDSLVGKWVARITRLFKALISTMRRLEPILRKLREIVEDLRALLRRLRVRVKDPAFDHEPGARVSEAKRGPDNDTPKWLAPSALDALTGKSARRAQRAIDSVIATDLSSLRLTFRPRYNGLNHFGISVKDLGVQLGKKALTSREQLIDTIVHEELHHRWFARGLRDHHPRDGSGTSDQFYTIVRRYLRMRGYE